VLGYGKNSKGQDKSDVNYQIDVMTVQLYAFTPRTDGLVDALIDLINAAHLRHSPKRSAFIRRLREPPRILFSLRCDKKQTAPSGTMANPKPPTKGM